MTDSPAAKLRNAPRQARSRATLQRVLNAAEKVLADEGASALTTTRIAEVARVAVGSVYRLFDDKEAIVDAVAIRYWSDFEDLVAALADADEHEPLEDPVGVILETLAAGFRAQPGFRALWYGGLRTERVRDATRGAREGFTRSLERIIAVHWAGAPKPLAPAAARMVVLMGDGLLREAFRLDPQGDAELLAEAKIALDGYLHTRLGDRTA
jgi:AcrR family transcriptional regulator